MDKIDLRHNLLPDPVGEMMVTLQDRILQLEKQLAELEGKPYGHKSL
jgi:serine O-acetyltransferase